MPQRTKNAGKSLFHTVFLAAALSLLSAVVRRERRQLLLTSRDRRKKVRVAPRKLAASLAFATLFFAGAAFSAGAGNGVVQLLDPASESASSTDTTTTTADAAPLEAPAPADASAQATAADSSTAQPAADPDTPGAPRPVASAQPAASPDVKLSSHTASVAAQAAVRAHSKTHSGGSTPGSRPASRPTGMTKTQAKELATFLKQAPVIQQQPRVLRAPVDREPEADEPNVAATVWLYRQLPDPTPPSRRLTPAFAHQLLRVSANHHVDWALALGVLRASGER